MLGQGDCGESSSKRARAQAQGTAGASRIEAWNLQNPALHPPQLDASHPAVVQVPSDDLCLYHCALAARNAPQWVVEHSAVNGWADGAAKQLIDVQNAQQLRSLVIVQARQDGNDRAADRLLLPGSAGQPTDADIQYLGKLMGGSILVQDGDEQVVVGSGPNGHAHASLRQH